MNAKLRVAAIGLLLAALAGLVLLVVRPSLNPATYGPCRSSRWRGSPS